MHALQSHRPRFFAMLLTFALPVSAFGALAASVGASGCTSTTYVYVGDGGLDDGGSDGGPRMSPRSACDEFLDCCEGAPSAYASTCTSMRSAIDAARSNGTLTADVEASCQRAVKNAMSAGWCSGSAGSSSSGDSSGPSHGTGDDQGKSDKKQPSTDPGTPNSPGTAGTTPPPPPPPPARCADHPNHDDCMQCCVDDHHAGYQVYETAIVDCLCAAAHPCAASCKASICASQNPDATCSACLNQPDNIASCRAPMSRACQSDADCTAMLRCWQRCPN